MSDLTSQTPVEIDTRLAELYMQQYAADARADGYVKAIQDAVGLIVNSGPSWRRSAATWTQVEEYLAGAEDGYEKSRVERLYASMDEQRVESARLQEEMAPFHAEYLRRGRWTRAFLVVNNNGHVHKSMSCSTCYDSTYFNWLPMYSGQDEDQIVADAGERACTVCYPSAPVDVLKRATKIFSEDEKAAQAARAEREAKRAARLAATITLTVQEKGWRAQSLVPKTVTWKTTRALQNDASSLVRILAGSGYTYVNGFDFRLTNDETLAEQVEAGKNNLSMMLMSLYIRNVDVETLVAKNVKRAQKEGLDIRTNWSGQDVLDGLDMLDREEI